MKILIVEDESLYSSVLEKICNDHGEHHIEVVDTLAEADKTLPELQPDLVISDKDLPDGIGTSRFKTIREQRPDVIICLLTGDPREVESHGADYFFRKSSFNMENLKKLLTEIEERRRAQKTQN